MKKIIAIAAASVLALSLAGCYSNDEYTERKEKQNAIELDSSLGITNQERRLQREEDPNTIRYVYIMSFAEVIGYYVIKGSVTSSTTQLTPEQEVIRYYGEPNILDSAKDNGTYGDENPDASFFFTAEDVLIETTLDYIQSDAPIPVYADVPQFG